MGIEGRFISHAKPEQEPENDNHIELPNLKEAHFTSISDEAYEALRQHPEFGEVDVERMRKLMFLHPTDQALLEQLAVRTHDLWLTQPDIYVALLEEIENRGLID